MAHTPLHETATQTDDQYTDDPQVRQSATPGHASDEHPTFDGIDDDHDDRDDDDRSWAEPPAPTDRRLRRTAIGLAIALFGVGAFAVGAKVNASRASSSSGSFPGLPAGFDPSALLGGGNGAAGFPGLGGGTGAATPAASTANAGDESLGGLLDGLGDGADPATTVPSEEATLSSVDANELIVTRADGSTLRIRIAPGTKVAIPQGSTGTVDAGELRVEEAPAPTSTAANAVATN